jgi:hypothetical protein
MLKRDLVFLIVKACLAVQKNHIHRIVIIKSLADKNKAPLRFLAKRGKHYYYLFTVSNIDLKYEDDGENWTVEMIN